ncbi:MAG: Uma2 family endonuclease [Chloroflexi bacterium]|nr:Uma2 family endonuclease [Chloroflexota bacterium]
MSSTTAQDTTIVYPDSDGMPMAENTLQFREIVTIQGNLDSMFRDRPDVFVAGDLLWYPVEGEPAIRRAPDAMVVFGRPKGDRGSYRQWEEGGIAPQVVFEVLSPGNTLTEMAEKFEFYDLYGVEEYYLYDPDSGDMSGWKREGSRLRVIPVINGWVSPRLQVRFVRDPDRVRMYRPDGTPFLSFVEVQAQMEQERQRAEQERQRAEQERQRAERMAQRLRELGVDPDAYL